VPKLTLSDLSNITGNEQSAITTINNNNSAIETALENTLSRDGTSPNSMGADLDMNSNDILNVTSIETGTLEATSIEASSYTQDGLNLTSLLLDWEGQWLISESYVIGDVVFNLGSSYVCIVVHTSDATNQPGQGALWETYWDLIVQGGTAGIDSGGVSTDNAVVRWDGLVGTAVQNSGVIIDDSNNVTGVGTLASGTHTITGNLVVSGTVDGRDISTDGTKLDTIETGAEVNDTAAEILTKLLTVDGPGSGLNADLLDNLSSADYYQVGGTDVTVADGGTGRSSATAYAVICGGTTATGILQSIASVGSLGQVLTSNGASALPTFETPGSGITEVAVQVFTASGTYTPTAGMAYCLVISTGAGGGGGGADNSDTSATRAGGGGGGGATCIELFSAATIGASQSVTIGTGGAGGANTGGNGGNGGDTTFGALHTAGGGVGATGGVGASSTAILAGGAGGTASGGLLNIAGGMGGYSTSISSRDSSGSAISGSGGGTFWGAGPGSINSFTSLAGIAGGAYGTGGTGGTATDTTTGVTGGTGADGVCFVLEFVN